MCCKTGAVCFTFDDRNFEGWISALPLFEKYNAHASFFISGDMDEAAIAVAKKLQDAGHTVGLHGKTHADAPEYFEKYGRDAYVRDEILEPLRTATAAGIKISSFAYPNNERNEETDKALLPYFNRFRTGLRSAGSEKDVYMPIDGIASVHVMHSQGIGRYYNTSEKELIAKICIAAQRNACVSFYSHNICENAEHIHMDINLLERCLAVASLENIPVLGYNEL